jgi:hypothetical protein
MCDWFAGLLMGEKVHSSNYERLVSNLIGSNGLGNTGPSASDFAPALSNVVNAQEAAQEGSAIGLAAAAVPFGGPLLGRALKQGRKVARGAAAGGRLTLEYPSLATSRKVPPATLGSAVSNDYRSTFPKVHPDLDGEVWVHHAIPQKVLKQYPNVVGEAELHSYENLRGIPLDVNSEVHLRDIATAWNAFYKSHPTTSKQELLDFATEIDGRFGHYFNPPR